MNVTIDPRYCGPTQSGNGGYSCGLLAGALGGAAEVTLRAPPPLGTPLQIVRDGEARARLEHDAQVIAEARRIAPEWPSPPTAPALDVVREAERHYAGHHAHDYPRCFACGPAREPGDGLRIFSGHVADGIVAAGWQADPSLADVDGRMPLPVLWAAIDCAGYWAAVDGVVVRPRMLLGRMSAVFDGAVSAGQTCIVLGWRERIDGRKHHAGTALFDANGRCLGQSRQTWIALRNDD